MENGTWKQLPARAAVLGFLSIELGAREMEVGRRFGAKHTATHSGQAGSSFPRAIHPQPWPRLSAAVTQLPWRTCMFLASLLLLQAEL